MGYLNFYQSLLLFVIWINITSSSYFTLSQLVLPPNTSPKAFFLQGINFINLLKPWYLSFPLWFLPSTKSISETQVWILPWYLDNGQCSISLTGHDIEEKASIFFSLKALHICYIQGKISVRRNLISSSPHQKKFIWFKPHRFISKSKNQNLDMYTEKETSTVLLTKIPTLATKSSIWFSAMESISKDSKTTGRGWHKGGKYQNRSRSALPYQIGREGGHRVVKDSIYLKDLSLKIRIQ